MELYVKADITEKQKWHDAVVTLQVSPAPNAAAEEIEQWQKITRYDDNVTIFYLAKPYQVRQEEAVQESVSGNSHTTIVLSSSGRSQTLSDPVLQEQHLNHITGWTRLPRPIIFLSMWVDILQKEKNKLLLMARYFTVFPLTSKPKKEGNDQSGNSSIRGGKGIRFSLPTGGQLPHTLYLPAMTSRIVKEAFLCSFKCSVQV